MSDHLMANMAAASPGARAGRRFGNFIKNNGYILLAFFASAGLALFVGFCQGIIPFGEKSILRIDLYHQYAPFFAELYERLVEGRSLLYSWNTGLGGGFLGNFFNYLSSPAGLLVLLFGHERIPEAISVMILLKCAFASGAFAYMLRKMLGKNDASITAFGILYSFCGFFIAYYWNVMWIDAMALLPLVALGIYYCVHKQKFLLYTITLSLTLLSNYYMGFMVCIFSVLFFLVEYFSNYQLGDKVTARRGSLRVLRSGAAFALGSLLAAALAAFALLPVLFALKSSSATSGTFTDKLSTYFSLFDFLANHFADVKPTIRSSGDVVLPNVYCGVITLLLVPVYLFAPSIKARAKICNVLLLLLLFFSFNTNILNYLWHAMHTPNDLPYRFSFVYSFLLLLLSSRALQCLKEIPGRVLMGIGGLLAFFILITEKLGFKNLQDMTTYLSDKEVYGAHYTIYITLLLLIAYLMLLAAFRKADKVKAASLSVLLLCCVVIEVCAADTGNFQITQKKATYVAGLSDFQAMKAQLDEDDPSFFRMELTDYRTKTDPAWYDYRGISTFSSMAYERTANLESRLGLGSNFINSYSYNPNTPIFNAMHNLKYLVENMSADHADGTFIGDQGSSYLPALSGSPLYTLREEYTRGRFTVFENNYPLSLAYWTDSAVKDWDTANNRNPFEIQVDYWQRASGVADAMVPATVSLNENFISHSGTDISLNGTYLSYNNKPAATQISVPLQITVEEARNVYIFVDSSYTSLRVTNPDGSTAWRDHDHQAIWDLGFVTPDAPLSVDIYLHKDDAPASGGFNVYVYGLNAPAFEAGYEVLSAGALQMEEFTETYIKGTVTAPADGLLYTSIPYDEGWEVLIDNQRIPVTQYIGIGNSGLLGVPISAGRHTVTLRYTPQGLTYGLIISAAGLVLLLAILLLGILLRRRSRKASEPLSVESMFSTEGMSPTDFSLDLREEEEEGFQLNLLPKQPEPEPSLFPTDVMKGLMEEYAAEFAPLPPPPSAQDRAASPSALPPYTPPPANDPVISESINVMLQEMQARAEELRRKMQLPPEDEDDNDGPSFRLT